MNNKSIERAIVSGRVELYKDYLSVTYKENNEVYELIEEAREELKNHKHYLFNEKVLKQLLYVTLSVNDNMRDTLKVYIKVVRERESKEVERQRANREFLVRQQEFRELEHEEERLTSEFSKEERKAIRLALGL